MLIAVPLKTPHPPCAGCCVISQILKSVHDEFAISAHGHEISITGIFSTGTADELMMAQTYSMKTAVAVFRRNRACTQPEDREPANRCFLPETFHGKPNFIMEYDVHRELLWEFLKSSKWALFLNLSIHCCALQWKQRGIKA